MILPPLLPINDELDECVFSSFFLDLTHFSLLHFLLHQKTEGMEMVNNVPVQQQNIPVDAFDVAKNMQGIDNGNTCRERKKKMIKIG